MSSGTETGFVVLTRSHGKRIYEYAIPGTGPALSVVADYLTVSDAIGEVDAALVALQTSGTYTGTGGVWQLEYMHDDDMPRWYELAESAAGTDPHYLNRVRAEEIRTGRGATALPPDRGIAADLISARLTVLRAVDGHDDADLVTAAAMLQRVIDRLELSTP